MFCKRRTIDTAPRDGTVIILEEDARGSYDVAHWSPEAGEWVGENGEPIKIAPSHWYPIEADLEHEGSNKPAQVGSPRARRVSIAATLVAVALVGAYFRADVAAFVTRSAGQEDILKGSTSGEQVGALPIPDPPKADVVALQQQAKVDQTSAQSGARVTQAAQATGPEAQQSLAREQHAKALTNEFVEPPPKAEAAKAAQKLEKHENTAGAMQEATAAPEELAASTAQDRRSLEEERARGAALTSELATARREIEAKVALLTKTREDATQFKQAAESITGKLQKERDSAEVSSSELAIARGEIETNVGLLNEARDDAAQFKQVAESTIAALQKERDNAQALSRELAIARREIEANVALLKKAHDDAAQYKQTAERMATELQQERESAKASSRELAIAHREIETNAALSLKAGDEAVQLKQAAESAMAELRQSLQQEHDRAEALASKLAGARQDLETETALSLKARDEAVQFKSAAESTVADLRQSLQRERGRAETLVGDLESARRPIDGRIVLERAPNSPIVQVTQGGDVAGSPDVARLVVRARALLGQGNIGGARIVLERAAETGSAQASFLLAETYDPNILPLWGTYGTRGEATKARELYARAHAGGIQEAKDRFNALSQGRDYFR